MRIEKILGSLEKYLDSIFRFFENNINLTFIVLFILSFLIRLLFTRFDSILREDAYIYLIKSIEISKGDFAPIPTYSLGLSLISAPFFVVFGRDSIFFNMIIAKIISNIISTSIILPLWLLSKEFLSKRNQIISMVLFLFYPSLVITSSWFLTEPLFTFFFLFIFHNKIN